ncbi:MAG: hypothetical protein K5695_10235 [Oscillospiraceae bacterium]|nr:hypothetical protein [Oscillospiraceae bacterium]
MSLFKKATAFLTALGITATMAGCGYNTRDALEVNGYSVPAGVYIYFANNAYSQALSQLKEENEDLDTEDKKAVQALTLEGKDVRTWVEDKATEMCVDFAATELKFDELGLELSEEDKLNLDSMMEYYWGNNQEVMEKNGIGESSFKKVITSSYKSDAIFEHYYGIGGELGVTEQDLYDYYVENNMRVQYTSFKLTDTEGNLMKSEEKAEMKKRVEGYQKRIEDAYAAGGADAAEAEMNAITSEYNEYLDSLTAVDTEDETTEADTEEETTEAAAEETTETAAEETTEAAAEETTEAAAEETTEAAAEETTEAAAEETTEAAAEAEEADAEETTEAAEGETAETVEETTEEAETTEAAEETTEAVEETTEAAAEETTEASEEETTEGDGKETTEAPTEDEETEEESDLHESEQIISVIHKEDYDDENDIYYNPSEKAYNMLLGIDPSDYGKPFFVEEDEEYYLVIRYDITERMTEDDLWTESTMSSTNYSMHTKDFEDLLDTWTDTMDVKRNEAAYKRYDPFKFDFT